MSYLQYQAPYGDNANRIVSILLTDFGIEQTKKIIEEKDFPYKHNWESAIWENVPKEMLATVYKGIHIKKQNNGLPTY